MGRALSSFRRYNKNLRQNLSKEELGALTSPSKNKYIVIKCLAKVILLLFLTRTSKLREWKVF